MAYRDFAADLVPGEPLTANAPAADAGLSDRVVRRRRARIVEGATLWVPTLGLAGWLQGSASAWLGDPLIGLVVTLLAMLPIIPLVAAGHA